MGLGTEVHASRIRPRPSAQPSRPASRTEYAHRWSRNYGPSKVLLARRYRSIRRNNGGNSSRQRLPDSHVSRGFAGPRLGITARFRSQLDILARRSGRDGNEAVNAIGDRWHCRRRCRPVRHAFAPDGRDPTITVAGRLGVMRGGVASRWRLVIADAGHLHTMRRPVADAE